MSEKLKLLLWGRPSSTNTQKAIWMLTECGLEFELRHASAWLGPGQNLYSDKESAQYDAVVDSPEYRAMNPNGTVPTLEHGGMAIYESHSIVRFLGRAFAPGLLSGGSPSAAVPAATATALGEAAASKWMDWSLAKLSGGAFPMKGIIDHSARLDELERDPQVLSKHLETFAASLAIVEAQLGRTPYLGGDSFSVGDIPMAVDFTRFKFALDSPTAAKLPAERRKEILDMTPNVNAWYAKLRQRQAFNDTVYISAQMHAGMYDGADLPEWLAAYMEASAVGKSRL